MVSPPDYELPQEQCAVVGLRTESHEEEIQVSRKKEKAKISALLPEDAKEAFSLWPLRCLLLFLHHPHHTGALSSTQRA